MTETRNQYRARFQRELADRLAAIAAVAPDDVALEINSIRDSMNNLAAELAKTPEPAMAQGAPKRGAWGDMGAPVPAPVAPPRQPSPTNANGTMPPAPPLADVQKQLALRS